MNWPTLAHDPTLTSIAASPQAKTPGAEIDDVDLDNLDSILAAADEAGHIYTLLDGCFPMGAASYASPAPFTTLFMHKDPLEPLLFLHPMIVLDSRPCTDVLPTTLDIRLLRERHVRDFARLSSAARELVHYMTRLTKDMRDVWYGGESHTGARLLGPKFLSEFEKKQQEFRRELWRAFSHELILMVSRIPSCRHAGLDAPAGDGQVYGVTVGLLGEQ